MSEGTESIAIIGLSGRFPGARDVNEFWTNLRSGRDCITFFSDQELLEAGVRAQDLDRPNYVRANGMVADIDLFDAGFFSLNPRDAEILDPQQRLFLECAWEVLEDGGYNPDGYPGLIGVFGGTTMSTYAFNLYNNPRLAGVVNDFQILISNDKDHLSTRVAYKLGLRGPAVTVGTACSTSLVAISMACQNLLDYQCDMALAGGATIGIPQKRGYVYEEGGISSPDGHCRSFDASAKGTVGGNGVAIVLLKRMSEAVADGDPIRAVIRGYGLNNDGSAKVGYTAPSVRGQAEVIAMALSMANVNPETITMLEAHGTATPLGDPIEFSALTEAYRKAKRTQYCALGSVKSNVGHMDSAAGAAGLIKCVLSLEHKQIPPSLYFERPNPKIDIANSPFFVNAALLDWEPHCGVRRAGVSSFGIGGTNAHVLLEEAPERKASGPSRPYQIIGFSARGAAPLDDMSARLGDHLARHPDVSLADVAYTLRVGRKEMPYRRYLVADTKETAEAGRLLKSKDPRHVISAMCEGNARSVAFLFPGQGAQYLNMARGVYENEPVFRRVLDECCAMLAPQLGCGLQSLLFSSSDDDPAQTEMLQQTWVTQPAVFAISYAYARLWMHWGVRPASMIGHSIGEYVAACLAGVFSLEDALRIVAVRGRVVNAMPPGAMLAVGKPADELQPWLHADLDLAAVNAPSLSVVSGLAERVAMLEQELRSQGVSVTRLHTSHAFHSRLVEDARRPLEEAIAAVTRNAPTIRFLSNVTGNWITAEQAQSPSYWSAHLRSTVRFADGLTHLLHEPGTILLEVGPGTALAGLVRQHPLKRASHQVLSSARHPLNRACDERVLLETLGRLWIEGTPINWTAFYESESRSRMRLPTYPFDRKRYWIDAPPETEIMPDRLTSGRLPLDEWFYTPRWVRDQPVPALNPDTPERWFVLGSAGELTDSICEQLRAAGQHVVRVNSGRSFKEVAPHEFEAPVEDAQALRDLMGRLTVGDPPPRRILHLWNLEQGADAFYSVLRTLQAAAGELKTSPLNAVFVTVRGQKVLSKDVVAANQAMAYAPALTMGQEYPHVRCRVVDMEDRTPAPAGEAAQHLIDEAAQDEAATMVAYRGHQRWRLAYEPVALAAPPDRRYPGTYLITGGLGMIGLLFAEFLARRGAQDIVLVGRSGLPAREVWDDVIEEPVRSRIHKIRAIETHGAAVTIEAADVGDRAAMADVFTRHRFDGIIHGAGYTRADAFLSLSELDTGRCTAHFLSKVEGTRIIAEQARRHSPDFICCLSSLSAVLGGLGFTAYAAANQYMDAFVSTQCSNGQTRWVSINWDGWMPDGDPLALEQAKSDPVILPEEGTEALERILAADDVHQVVVSTSELGRRLEQWASPVWNHREKSASPASPSHPRPSVSTDFEAPAEGKEHYVAEVWRDLLGLDRVGANDNFFELGGHSLLAIQVISRLRDALGRNIGVRVLFDHPTVRELAAVLEEKNTDLVAPDMIDLLEKVEQMSDEEARSLLGTSEAPADGGV